MTTPIEAGTARLRLRTLRDADREPFAALSADPEAMRRFPGTWSRGASDAVFDHPARPDGHPLRRHRPYRVASPQVILAPWAGNGRR